MRTFLPGDFWLYAECVLLALLLTSCAPLQCKKVSLELTHSVKMPAPAAHLNLRCDDQTILEVEAATLTTGRP